MAFPPVLNAAELVNSGWNLFSGIADQGFSRGLSLANTLSNFDVPAVNFDASFNPVAGVMQGFDDPVKPDTPDFDFQVEIPDTLAINTISIPDFGEPPTDDLTAPTLDFTGQPGPLDIAQPPAPPDFFDAEIPGPPDIFIPGVPDFEELDIPDPPPFVEVEFDSPRPEQNIPEPDTFIDFTEEEYSSELLDETTAVIQRMLDDGTGMPVHVEQALVDRGRERVTAEAKRVMQQAYEEWSSRGFSLPTGSLDKRISEVRQASQDQANAFSRDVMIQRRQEEIENFRFAVSQGIALEAQLIQMHLDVQQRALDFARAISDNVYRLFEARIALFNSELAQFQADAQVFEQRIRAEVNKLQQYQARLEGEAIKSQINESKVRAFQAQIAALGEVVSLYRGRVEAVRAIADTNNARANAFNSQIQGFRAQVEAKTEEFAAWEAKVRGELGKVQGFEAETRAFAARTQAYEAGVRAKAIVPEVEARLEQSRIDQVLAQLETVRTRIAAEEAKIRGKASAFSSEASMYSADGQIASAKAETNTRQFLALVEQRRTEAERALAKAQLDVEQTIRSGTIVAGALDSAGRIASQTGAGAASAVRLGAGISASDSWQRNISIDGNI